MVSANQSPTVVTITSPGPQGPQGPAGPPGGATTGSNTFTGNQTISGSILISGSIIPAVGTGQLTSSFDLGSSTAAWKDIYVSNGSVKFIDSGSPAVILSAKDGGISINGGSTISADGVSGQFITSKSLSDNVTVKDSNNSLLMGPIEVETDKEIVVEEGSDLTIFGDIEITNVATANAALFATSASFSDSSSYASSASYADNTISSSFASTSSVATSASYAASASYTNTSSYASSASFSNTSSYALTASYALNTTTSSTFPYSGSAVITGSLIVHNAGSTIVDTNIGYLNDDTDIRSVLWKDRILKDAGGVDVVNWENKVIYDNAFISSIDWGNRLLYNNNNHPSIDWQNGLLYRSNNTLAIDYNTPGIYGFVSASSSIINTTPGASTNVQVAFAQSGSNFFIYVYMGGRWRSASLS